MRFNNLDESLPTYTEDQDFDQTLYEFSIGIEDFNSFKGEYIEPISDVGRAIVKSAKGLVKPISDKVQSFMSKRRDKKFIIEKIEEKLREDDLLDRLLSNDMIKVTLSKVDNEYLVRIKAKSDKRIQYFLVTHQLNRDGNEEFDKFKDDLKNKIPKLIRKTKNEFKLNIANESVNSILKAYEDLYGTEKLEELKDRLK